jgi:hypothetical protein
MINKRPMITVLFEVPYYHCSKPIQFLIDTGATNSAITEKESELVGLDCDVLPEAKTGAVGFGGTFKNKMINRPVSLTFSATNDQTYKVPYAQGFQIVCIPAYADKEEREKLRRYTPCVLGMDILCKFKIYIDKKKVELSL